MEFTLHFKARGGVMVPHYGHGGAGRYIGRKYSPDHGHPSLDAAKNRVLSGGWPATKEGEKVTCDLEHFVNYQNEVKAGALWAADAETAKICGVEFDEKFGGEFDDESKLWGAPKSPEAKPEEKPAEPPKAPETKKKTKEDSQ